MIPQRIITIKKSLALFLVALFVSFFLFYKIGSLPSDVEEMAQMFNSFLILGKVNKNIPGQDTPLAIARQNPYFSTLSGRNQDPYHVHAFSSPLQFLSFNGAYRTLNLTGRFWRLANLYSTSPSVVGKYVLSKLKVLPMSEELARDYYLLTSSRPMGSLASPFISVMLLSAILGLLTVMTLYFSAQKMYGTKEAVISSILLVSSYPFLIEVRGAWLQHVLNLFTTTLAIYLFYVAHTEKKWRYLFLCALSLTLVGISGYNGPIVLPLIFLVFFLFNVNYRSYTLGLLLLISGITLIFLYQWKILPLVLLMLILSNPKGKVRDILHLGKEWLRLQIFPLFKSGRLLGLGKYLVLAAAAGLFYYLFITNFSTHYGFSKWEVVEAMRKIPKWTRGITPMGQWDYPSELDLNSRFLVKSMFVEMLRPRETFYTKTIFRAGITHFTQVMPGKPMIAPLVTLFSFLGLFWLMRKKMLLGDKLVIPWAIVPFVLYGVYLGYQPRYLLVAIPGLSLLAARGLVKTHEKLAVYLNGWGRWLWGMVLASFLAWTVYSHYQGYFGYYAQNDGFYTAIAGQHQMAQYILNYAEPERQAVVLGNPGLVTYDNFYFNTAGKPYWVRYWDSLLGEFAAKDNKHDAASLSEKLLAWEKEILKEKEQIFFVFSIGPHFYEMPGEFIPGQQDYEVFTLLHFGLKPAKTIYHSSGVPSLAIYIIDKNTPTFRVKAEKIAGEDLAKFFAKDSFSGFTISGKNLENLDLKTVGGVPLGTLFKNLPNLEKIEVDFKEKARVTFSPYLKREDLSSLSRKQNIETRPNAPPLHDYCLGKEKNQEDSFFTYGMKTSYPIKTASVQSSLRLFNDKKKKNGIFSYYSLDNSNYEKLFGIRSHGGRRYDYGVDANTRWTAAKTKETYNQLSLDSKTLYLKFAFEGKAGESLVCSPLTVILDLDLSQLLPKEKPTMLEVSNPNTDSVEVAVIE